MLKIAAMCHLRQTETPKTIPNKTNEFETAPSPCHGSNQYCTFQVSSPLQPCSRLHAKNTNIEKSGHIAPATMARFRFGWPRRFKAAEAMTMCASVFILSKTAQALPQGKW